MVVPTVTAIPQTTALSTHKNAGAAGLGDPLYPQLGNGGYDVLHYTIDLTVAMATHAITGTTTIAARATQILGAFNFDLQGLTVHAIEVNQAAAAFNRVGSELTITPTMALTSGEIFSTTMVYQPA
jgi:hypothetical protein